MGNISGFNLTTRCPTCGSPSAAGRCLACDLRRWARFVHRELTCLLILVVISVGAFFVTRAVADGNDALRLRQSANWFAAAEQSMRVGDSERALTELRRAAIRDPHNRRYRLALAGMLAGAGRDAEARRLLLALREAAPEAPETNLQLARIEARAGDADAARRYYQAAIAGLWTGEQVEPRRRVRLELIDFLLARDERARALSELFALQPRLPADAVLQARVGRLFLAAGDARVALEHFGNALRADGNNPDALAGAGEAAFQLGDYARAVRHLAVVAPTNAHAAELRTIAGLVLTEDPLAPRLGSRERRDRIAAVLRQATARLDGCAMPTTEGTGVLDTLRSEAKKLDARIGRLSQPRLRDLADDVVHLAYRIEEATASGCAMPASAFDRALVLIARRHNLETL